MIATSNSSIDAPPRQEPVSVAERARKHRRKRRNLQGQLAIAIAALIKGDTPMSQRLILKEFLEKQSTRAELGDDQLNDLDAAIDKLASKFSNL